MEKGRKQPFYTKTTGICPGIQFGPKSQSMLCPSCKHQIRTSVVYEASNKTHIVALLLCIFLCWPCILVPYCTDSCKNANHYCPICSAFLGTYKN